MLTTFFRTFSGAYNRAVLTFERCLHFKSRNFVEGNLAIFSDSDVKFQVLVHYFLIILNLDFDNNATTFHLLNNYKSFKNLRGFKDFSESGAYNRGGAYIQSYGPRGGAYNRGGAYFRAGLQSSAYGI